MPGSGPHPTESAPGVHRATRARNLIHVGLSLLAAAAVWRFPHPGGAILLAGATLVALSVELARWRSTGFAHRFRRAVGPMLRDGETRRLTGATTLAIGYTVAATAFPVGPALAGILVAGLADPAAALAGRRFGRRRWRSGKSLEGSTAFLLVAFLLVLSVPGIGAAYAALVALLATAAEAAPLPIDDNIYLPALTAAAVSAAPLLYGLGGFS
jgi:dolichol kinase